MLKEVAIGLIRENAAALRTVNRKSENYLGLIESMRINGFMGSIVVRVRKDEDTGAEYYELCDGLHRFSAAKEAGLSVIGVDIKELDDDQILEAQIMGNFHKIETKPVEYSKALKRILTRNPLMTEPELASRLGVGSTFIRQRLSLNKITNKEILALIEESKIPLANAYLLAKLPEEELSNFVDAAITEPPDQFIPKIQERIKEINEAKRKGRKAEPVQFKPVAHMQKMKDIKDARDDGTLVAALIDGVDDPAEAAQIVLDWVLHLDKKSIVVAEAKWDEKQKAKDEAKAKKTAEKESAKKAKEEAAAGTAAAVAEATGK